MCERERNTLPKSRQPRDTYRYTLRGKNNEILYYGITTDPNRRAAEHKRNGNPGKMRIEGPRATKGTALKWEPERIIQYRKRNGPDTLNNRTFRIRRGF